MDISSCSKLQEETTKPNMHLIFDSLTFLCLVMVVWFVVSLSVRGAFNKKMDRFIAHLVNCPPDECVLEKQYITHSNLCERN